tara:strand:- start:78 stop:515 length:438 start_codon:yes stop_codon:yes gene_type:complete
MAETTSKDEIDLIMTKLFPSNISDYIVPKYSLLKEIKASDGVRVIVAYLRKIPDVGKKKNDMEILLMACNFLENLKLKKGETISKDEMLKMIYFQLFAVNPTSDEAVQLLTRVQFLKDHKKIRKIPMWKKVYVCSLRYFSCKSFL